MGMTQPCARRVSAARLAPTSGEVVMRIQSGSVRTDSTVRILHAQPCSPVSADYPTALSPYSRWRLRTSR